MIINPFYKLKPRTFDTLTLGLLKIQDFSEIQDASTLKSICIIEPSVDSESASQQSWLSQIKTSLEKLNRYDTVKVSCKQLFVAFFSSSNQFSIIRIRVDMENNTNTASKVMIYQSMETELPELLAIVESLTKTVKGVFTTDTGSETIRTHITNEAYSSGFLALLNLRTLFKGEEPTKEVAVPFGAYELRRQILDDLKQMSSKTKDLVEKFEVLQFEDIDIENPFILRELFDKFFKGLTRADRRELRDLSYNLTLEQKQTPPSFFPSEGNATMSTQEIDAEIKILDPLINWLKKRSDKLREVKSGIISLFDLIFYQHNINEAKQSQMIVRLNHVMRLIPEKKIITISTIGDELRKTKEIISTTLAKEDIAWNDKLLITHLEERLIGSRIDNLDHKSSLVMCLTRHLTDYYKPINLKKSRKNKVIKLYEEILPTVSALSEEKLVAKILTEKVEDTLVNAYLVNLAEKKLKPLHVQERKGDEQEIPLVLMKTKENQYITFTSMQKFYKLDEYVEWLTGQIVNDKLIMPACLKAIQELQNGEQIFSYVSEIYQKVRKTKSIEELNSQLQGTLLNDHAFFNELSKIERQLSTEQKSDVLAKVRSSVLSLLQSAFEDYNQLILYEHHKKVLEAEREITKAEEEKNQRLKEIIETENAIKAEQAELERLQKLAQEAMAKSEAEKAELDAQIKQNQEEIQRKTELARKKKAIQIWTSLLEDIAAITFDTIKKRDTYMEKMNSGFSDMTTLKDFALTLVPDQSAYDQDLLNHFCSLQSSDEIAKNVQYFKNILNPPKATLINNTVKITGYSFTLNEALLNAKDLLTPDVELVHILAVKDLFVEPLANPDIFLQTSLFLLATNINIEDDVVIKTDGRPIPAMEPTKAPNGKDPGMSGDRGASGKNGGNAGNVVIKAQGVIKDVHRLEIIANGADGQAGQDGGDGADGASGRSGVDGGGEKIEHNRLLGLYKASVEKGTGGTQAGDGGNGGASGLGGQGGACGRVSLQDKDGDQTLKIKLTAKPGVQGKDGTPGQGGRGGKPGENGIDFGKQQIFFEKSTLRGTVGLQYVQRWGLPDHWIIFLEKNENDTRMPKYGAGKDGTVMQLVEDTAIAQEAAQELVIPTFDELDMMKLSFAAKNFADADQIQDTDFQLDQNIHNQVSALKDESDALMTEINKANAEKTAGDAVAQDKMKVLGDAQNKQVEDQKLLQEKVNKLEGMVDKERKEFDEAVKKRDEMNKMFTNEKQIVTQLNETVQRVSDFKESSPSRKKGLTWPSGQPFNQNIKLPSTLSDSKLKIDWATLEALLNKHKHTARVFVEHFIDLLETFVLLFFSEQSPFSKNDDDENVKASTISALSSLDTVTLLECSKILRSAINKKLNKVALDPQEEGIKDLFFALIEDKNIAETDDSHPDFIKAKTKLDQLYGYLVKLCLSQPKAQAIEYMKAAIKVDSHKKPENKLSKLFWKHTKHLGRFFSNFRKLGRNFRFDMVSKIKTMIELATNTEEGNDGIFMTLDNTRDRKIIFNLEMCSMSRHYFAGEYTNQDYPLDAAMDDFNYSKSPDALLKVVMTFEQQMAGPDYMSVAPSRLAGEPSIFFVLTVYKAIAHLDLTPTHLVLMRSGFERILKSGVLYKSNARFEMMLDQCEKLTKARLRSWEGIYSALEKVLTAKNQAKPEKVEEQSLLVFIKSIYRLENSTLPSSTKTNRKTRICEKLSSQSFSDWSSIIEEKDLTQNYWNLIRRSWSKILSASVSGPGTTSRARPFRSRPVLSLNRESLIDSQLDEDTLFKDDMIKKASKIGDHEFVDDVREIFEKVSSALRNAPATPEFKTFKQAFETKLSKLFDELASLRRSEDKRKLKLMSKQVLQKSKALLHELVTFCDVQRLQQQQPETEMAPNMERTHALKNLLKDTNSSFEFGAVINDSTKEAMQVVFIRLETLREEGEFNQDEELLCQRIKKRINDYGEEYFIRKFVDIKDNDDKHDLSWTILSRSYKTLLTFADESFARVSPLDIADFILHVMVVTNEKRKKEKEENKSQPMNVQGYVSWFCLHLLKPQDQDQNTNKDQDPSGSEPPRRQDPLITYEYVKGLMEEKTEWKTVFEKCVKIVPKDFRLLNRVIFVIKCYDWDERALNTLREVINNMLGEEKNLNESLTLIAQMILDRFKELFLKPLVDKVVVKAKRGFKTLKTAKLEQMLEFIHIDTDLPAMKVSLNGVVACAESLVIGLTEYREKVDICFKHILVFSDSVVNTLKDLKSSAKDFNKSLNIGVPAYEKDFVDRIHMLLKKLNTELSSNPTSVRSWTPIIIRVLRIVSIAIQQAYIQYEMLDKLDKIVYDIRVLIEAKDESSVAPSISYDTNAVFIQYLQSSKQVWVQKLDQMFADFKKLCCLDEEFVQEQREKVLDRIQSLISHILPDEKRRILDLIDYNLRKIEYIWILASKVDGAQLDFIPEVYKKLDENLTESEEHSYETTHYEMIDKFLSVLSKASSELCKKFTDMFGSENLNNVIGIVNELKKIKEEVTTTAIEEDDAVYNKLQPVINAVKKGKHLLIWPLWLKDLTPQEELDGIKDLIVFLKKYPESAPITGLLRDILVQECMTYFTDFKDIVSECIKESADKIAQIYDFLTDRFWIILDECRKLVSLKEMPQKSIAQFLNEVFDYLKTNLISSTMEDLVKQISQIYKGHAEEIVENFNKLLLPLVVAVNAKEPTRGGCGIFSCFTGARTKKPNLTQIKPSAPPIDSKLILNLMKYLNYDQFVNFLLTLLDIYRDKNSSKPHMGLLNGLFSSTFNLFSQCWSIQELTNFVDQVLPRLREESNDEAIQSILQVINITLQTRIDPLLYSLSKEDRTSYAGMKYISYLETNRKQKLIAEVNFCAQFIKRYILTDKTVQDVSNLIREAGIRFLLTNTGITTSSSRDLDDKAIIELVNAKIENIKSTPLIYEERTRELKSIEWRRLFITILHVLDLTVLEKEFVRERVLGTPHSTCDGILLDALTSLMKKPKNAKGNRFLVYFAGQSTDSNNSYVKNTYKLIFDANEFGHLELLSLINEYHLKTIFDEIQSQLPIFWVSSMKKLSQRTLFKKLINLTSDTKQLPIQDKVKALRTHVPLISRENPKLLTECEALANELAKDESAEIRVMLVDSLRKIEIILRTNEQNTSYVTAIIDTLTYQGRLQKTLADFDLIYGESSRHNVSLEFLKKVVLKLDDDKRINTKNLSACLEDLCQLRSPLSLKKVIDKKRPCDWRSNILIERVNDVVERMCDKHFEMTKEFITSTRTSRIKDMAKALSKHAELLETFLKKLEVELSLVKPDIASSFDEFEQVLEQLYQLEVENGLKPSFAETLIDKPFSQMNMMLEAKWIEVKLDYETDSLLPKKVKALLLNLQQKLGKALVRKLAECSAIKQAEDLKVVVHVLSTVSNHVLILDDEIYEAKLKNHAVEKWEEILSEYTEQQMRIQRDYFAMLNLLWKDNIDNDLMRSKLKKWIGEMCTNLEKARTEESSIIKGYGAIGKWSSKTTIQEWTRALMKKEVDDRGKMLPEILAVVFQGYSVTKNLQEYPRGAQVIVILLLLQASVDLKGRLGQVSTGEGKTLIVACFAVLRVLHGDKVDIISSSSVLASRDAEKMQVFYGMFDITASCNCDEKSLASDDVRRQKYKAHVVYGDLATFQRDVLLTDFYKRDTFAGRKSNCLIVDEVDSMLLDKGENMLYLSHNIPELWLLIPLLIQIWQYVHAPDVAFGTPDDIKKIHALIQKQIKENEIPVPASLTGFVERVLMTRIKKAFQAASMKEDDSYTVTDAIVVVDNDTGVEQMNTQWSQGLHQFMQLKHLARLSPETLRAVFISNLSYFRRFAGRLYGLTGTLGSKRECDFLSKIYGVEVFKMPRYKLRRYVQTEPLVANDKSAWHTNIISVIQKYKEEKRAMLFICENLGVTQELFKIVSGIWPQRTYKYAAFSTLEVGGDNNPMKPGDVLIATNIAGRGTDLELDSQVLENGGLHTVLTYMPHNIRIEEQAFGRSARNGMPGSGQFVVVCPIIGLSVEEVRRDRDEKECQRIEDIKVKSVQKIEKEEELFTQFMGFYEKVSECLRRVMKSPQEENTTDKLHKILYNLQTKLSIGRASDKNYIDKQLKALLTGWAFWLDSVSESLNTLYKTDHKFLDKKFNEFIKSYIKDLKKNEENGLLIKTPLGLTELARQFEEQDNTKQAQRIYQAVIDSEPNFCEAALCYNAVVKIQEKGSLRKIESEIKHDLKKAEKLIRKKINYYSSSMMILRHVDDKRRKQGCKGNVDRIQGQIHEMIRLYGLHLKKIEDFLGTYIDKSFIQRFPRMTGDDMRTKMLDYLQEECEKWIKPFRLSKKVFIKNDEIMFKKYNGKDKKIKIPSDLLFFKADLIEDFNKRLTSGNRKFLQKYLNIIVQDKKSLWEIFEQAKILKKTGDVNMLNTSDPNKIASFDFSYLDRDDARKVLAILTNASTMGWTYKEFSSFLDEDEYADLIKHLTGLNMVTVVPRGVLSLGIKRASNNYVLDLPTKMEEYRMVLDEIPRSKKIHLGSIMSGKLELEMSMIDIPGPATREDGVNRLWIIFMKKGLVKFPSLKINKDVNFRQQLPEIDKHVIQLFDKIKAKSDKDSFLDFEGLNDTRSHAVKSEIARLFKGTVGLRKRVKTDIKVGYGQINEFLPRDTRTPDTYHMLVALEFHRVLVFERKRKIWDWNVFCVFMIGLAEVAAAATITVFSCAAGLPFSHILLTEGFKDMTYAIKMAISGEFSWNEYLYQKAISVGLSVLFSGVAPFLGFVSVLEPSQSYVVYHTTKDIIMAGWDAFESISVNFVINDVVTKCVYRLITSTKKLFRKEFDGRVEEMCQCAEKLFDVSTLHQALTFTKENIQRVSKMFMVNFNTFRETLFDLIDNIFNMASDFSNLGWKDFLLKQVPNLLEIGQEVYQAFEIGKQLINTIDSFKEDMGNRTKKFEISLETAKLKNPEDTSLKTRELEDPERPNFKECAEKYIRETIDELCQKLAEAISSSLFANRLSEVIGKKANEFVKGFSNQLIETYVDEKYKEVLDALPDVNITDFFAGDDEVEEDNFDEDAFSPDDLTNLRKGLLGSDGFVNSSSYLTAAMKRSRERQNLGSPNPALIRMTTGLPVDALGKSSGDIDANEFVETLRKNQLEVDGLPIDICFEARKEVYENMLKKTKNGAQALQACMDTESIRLAAAHMLRDVMPRGDYLGQDSHSRRYYIDLVKIGSNQWELRAELVQKRGKCWRFGIEGSMQNIRSFQKVIAEALAIQVIKMKANYRSLSDIQKLLECLYLEFTRHITEDIPTSYSRSTEEIRYTKELAKNTILKFKEEKVMLTLEML